MHGMYVKTATCCDPIRSSRSSCS